MGEDRKTVEGALAPADDAPLGTIQLRPGAPLADPAPVMPTVTGTPVIAHAPPAMPPARYELGSEIARGGMGRVVEATDTTLGRVVALKEALSLDPDTLRRFARETRITARLEHPSIVPVHDAGIGPNGTPYYVMRKIGGRPLERLVATGETLNERLALIPHIVAAAHAIAHAHERGVVHRDIKPSNILVGDLGETIVIDWGLAKVIGEPEDEASAIGSPLADPLDAINTRIGVVYGTPGFMAPEQLRGHPVDPRCDVYALGATLYHLLSRKPPHHAHTADEMMRAAVNAPPMPIGELVAGVPPELSTIIDTSLAHDPARRYPHAGALAEDLQRFLTGQLVASHHYSPRQRLARFYRTHRTPVLVSGLAATALVLGGVVAVSRIIDERDRADAAAIAARKDKQLAEDQRALAEQRSDELTLSQARAIAGSNPTLAIAMIKPLAAKERWREVISVAAAARAAGVAWSLPASATTTSLEMSRDGQQALAAGGDGIVRVYDLATRAVTTVAETGLPAHARYADGERKIVLWHEATLTVIDRPTGGRRDLTVTSPIEDLEVIGITAYWVDRAGALWQLDLAGTNPLQLAMDERILELAPSPDGRWIALAGTAHLLLHDRTQPATPPLEVTTGKTGDFAWASDGSHLTALVDDTAIDVLISPVPTLVQRVTVGTRWFITYGNNRVYTIGPTGVAVVAREGSGARRQLTGSPLGLFASRGGAVIAGSEKAIAVMSDRGDRTLIVGDGRLTTVQASASSPYVVGAISGQLLVWNLAELEARELATGVASAHVAGQGQVLATFGEGPAQLIDIDKGTRQVVGDWAAVTAVAGTADGALAVVLDLAHRAILIGPGREPKPIGEDIDLVGFATDHQVLLHANTGMLQLHDTTSHAHAMLISRKAKLDGTAWSRSRPTWVAAVFRDQTLWRKNLATGSEDTTQLPKMPTSSLLVRPDGSVLYAVDAELRAWRADGEIDTHAKFPRAVIDLAETGSKRAVAFSEHGDAYVFDLDGPARVVDQEQRFGTISMSAVTGLIVEPKDGSIHVLDPLIKDASWKLAEAENVRYLEPQISRDGRHVIARAIDASRSSKLLVWPLDLPATQADTIAWLDRLTNAISGSGSRGLDWK